MTRTGWAIVTLALAPPVQAAVPLGAETELHVEARGVVRADSALLRTTSEISAPGKDACEAQLAARLAAIRADFAAAGVAQGAVTLTPSACTAGKGDAALTALMPPAARTAGSALPFHHAKIAISARVDAVAPAIKLLKSYGNPFVPGGIKFVYAHPDTLDQQAYAAARAKADSDAQVLAHQFGAHVVRIARVSNRGGALAQADVLDMIGGFAPSEFDSLPLAMRAQKVVSLSIDYVIAPD